MTRTPKESFIASTHRKPWEDVTMLPSFEVACQTALVQMLIEQPMAVDPSKGWDNHSQMVGARRILQILSRLHEPNKQTKPTEPPTLNYSAGV